MTLEAREPSRLRDALAGAGVRRAKVKIPVPVPPTNAWMVGEGEVTMVDCGLLWGDALDRLRAPLQAHERVARVLVTHGHPDHHGAAAALVKVYGCTVHCHAFDADAVRAYHATLLGRFATWGEAARENGMPEAIITPMAGHYRALDRMGADVSTVHKLAQGETVEAGGLKLEVMHVPGHTAGSVAFFERQHGLLFSGDTVLPGITPNPFFEGLFDESSGPLPFLQSIARLRTLPVRFVLPGHGEPMGGLAGILDLYERHHADRRAAIVRVLRERRGATGFELVESLFPGVSRLDQWLAMAEVLGHLQHLASLGEVKQARSSSGINRWRAAP